MDMMCSRCRKRPAVVFMSGMSGTQKFENGYCLKCAKELGIPQVDNYLKQMGLSDIDLDADPLQWFGNRPGQDTPELDEIEDDEDYDEEYDENEEDAEADEGSDEDDPERVDGFRQGGTMPAFFQRFFESPANNAANKPENTSDGSGASRSDTSKKERDKKKKQAEKHRKFLNTFCTNLTENARNGKTDRIIGRDREIERVIQILPRRKKAEPDSLCSDQLLPEAFPDGSRKALSPVRTAGLRLDDVGIPVGRLGLDDVRRDGCCVGLFPLRLDDKTIGRFNA